MQLQVQVSLRLKQNDVVFHPSKHTIKENGGIVGENEGRRKKVKMKKENILKGGYITFKSSR